MLCWDISIPIEGKAPVDLKPIECSEVLFHIYDDPFLKRKQLFGTRAVEGDRLVAEEKAVVMIDEALTKLHLLHLFPLSLMRYDIRIMTHDDSRFPQVGPQRVSVEFTDWYRIGEDQTSKILSNLENIKPEKKHLLDIILSSFRVALCSLNPYQAIESYFSCVTSITRENLGLQNIEQHHLEEELRKAVGYKVIDFDTKFKRYYGKRRSAASHGHVNILDPTEIVNARYDAGDLKLWTRGLIISFLDNNQIS
jgi:hypothetical protein